MKVLLCVLTAVFVMMPPALIGAETADRLLWERITGTVETVEARSA